MMPVRLFANFIFRGKLLVMNDRELVYKITSFIPEGRVLTYGSLAKIVGLKSPLVVGNILHKNKNPNAVSCHRVVNSEGMVSTNYAFGGASAQTKKLEQEGIKVINGKVDLAKYLWEPEKI